MRRGLRIFVAFFGVALIGAAPQPSASNAGEKPSARHQPAKRPAPVPWPAPQVAERPILTEPCEPGQDNRRSDLCAQWEAADAARDAANWAMWATLVGIVSVLGLWIQIWLTRKSLDVAMADRRPSIYSDNVKFEVVGNTVKGQISIKNFGQSEARDVAFKAAISFGPYPLPDDPPPLTGKAVPSGKMPPGTLRYQYVERHDFDKWQALVADEKAAFLMSGSVSYKDQFGRPYTERFDYFTTGKDFELRALRICDPWNEEERTEPEPDPKEPEFDLKGGGKDP